MGRNMAVLDPVAVAAVTALPPAPLFFRVLVVVVPLAMMLVCGTWFARTVPRVLRARPASGVLVDVGQTAMHEGRPIWRLTVEYVDEAGRPRRGVWSGESNLDRTMYRVGMTLPVRYDPQRPEWVQLPGGGRPHPLLVPAGMFVLGLVLLVGFQQLP